VCNLNFYLLDDKCLERSFECMHRLPRSLRTMIVRRVFGILRVQLSEMLNFQVPKATRLDPERLPENFGKVVVTRI
jgi:hypothetical protein